MAINEKDRGFIEKHPNLVKVLGIFAIGIVALAIL